MNAKKAAQKVQNAQFGLFPLAVTGVQRLGEHFVRVSLAGASLRCSVEEIAEGTGQVFDAYIKLMIAPASSVNGLVDMQLDENWRARYMAASAEERGYLRTYTVRNSRLVPAASVPRIEGEFQPYCAADLTALRRDFSTEFVPEIDIDFVIHQDEDGVVGPGAAWAAAARVGDQISILAPVRGSRLWSSWNPGRASKLLVLADETAVPAALSVARSLPEGTRADFLLEVPGEPDLIPQDLWGLGEDFATRCPDVKMHWLPRDRAGAASGEELYRVLRDLLGKGLPASMPVISPIDDGELVWGLAEGEHPLYIFIAGESSVVKTLRRICVSEGGIDKRHISFMGYWRRGLSES